MHSSRPVQGTACGLCCWPCNRYQVEGFFESRGTDVWAAWLQVAEGLPGLRPWLQDEGMRPRSSRCIPKGGLPLQPNERGLCGCRRLWAGRILLGLGLPALILAIGEVSLRILGLHWPTSYFVHGRSGDEPCWVENDRFGWLFFPKRLARHPPPTVMALDPPSDGCRIFVLGESAAMGDPCPAYSIGRFLEVLLQARYAERRVEVITVAMTAINSHALLSMARECARRGGDIWIVYCGNNEMVGPLGALGVLGPSAPPRSLVRLRLALQQTALGQGAQELLDRCLSRQGPPGGWGGMEMFADQRLAQDAPARLRAYVNFERNLRDIVRIGLRSGVSIVVSPAAVNLRDCAPFASCLQRFDSGGTPEALQVWFQRGVAAEAAGDRSAAFEAYRAAAALAPEHAELQFRFGRLLLQMGRIDEARKALQRACDLDALPFRADSRVRTIAARVAAEAPADRVCFFDATAVLASRSPDGIPGSESFYEHVHLNPSGNYALARAMAEKIEPWLRLKGFHSSRPWLSEVECAQRLGLSEWSLIAILENVQRRLRQPPFTVRALPHLELTCVESELKALRSRFSVTRIPEVRQLLATALQERPRDFRLWENQAEFLEATGDPEGALQAWAEVIRFIPHHHLGWFHRGRLLGRLGRWAQAEEALRSALLRRPELSEAWLELGLVQLQLNRPREALNCFAQASRLLPQDWRATYQKGRALVRLERLSEAAEAFQAALVLNPEAVEPRYHLAETLAFIGRTTEARDLFIQVLQKEPRHLLARINLGVSLVRLGQWQAAAEQLREAEKLAPGHPLISNYLAQVQAQLRQKP